MLELIYTDVELREKIYKMRKDFETEAVEFKDIGKYFSALGNEDNIRGKSEERNRVLSLDYVQRI